MHVVPVIILLVTGRQRFSGRKGRRRLFHRGARCHTIFPLASGPHVPKYTDTDIDMSLSSKLLCI